MLNVEFKTYDGEVITSTEIIGKIEICAYNHHLDNGLDDLYECPTGVFNNILRDVGQDFFKPLNAFRLPHDRLDYKALNEVLDLYIYLCEEYNKAITYMGFDGFIGSFRAYSRNPELVEGFNGFSITMMKKIDQADNNRMLGRAQDSKQAVLNLAYNNYRHNWAGTIRSQEVQSVTKSLEDVRRERISLSANDEQSPRFVLGNNDENAKE